MILFKNSQPLQNELKKLRNQNMEIGFVPTMGALHKGHLSLIKAAKNNCDVVVCSIFVNPTQFNEKIDFERYPVTAENDIYLLETNKADILFLPSVNEIYAEGLLQLQHFELDYFENILEGKYRPGHFQGVCNVVFRLLNIIQPNTIFLGSKDYQQYLVVKIIMQQFYPSINIAAVDIVREENGLAMSSRNTRLSSQSRNNAAVMYQSLQLIKENIAAENIESLKEQAKEKMLHGGFDKIDYVEVCNAKTLLPVSTLNEAHEMIALAAAFIDGVRLIDNILL